MPRQSLPTLFVAGGLETESTKRRKHVGADGRDVFESWIEYAHGDLLWCKILHLPGSFQVARSA